VGVKLVLYFLTAPWNHIFLGEVKNGGCDEAIENCTIGEHPAVLANNNLLANKSIIAQARYWRVNRNRTSKAALIFASSFPPSQLHSIFTHDLYCCH